MLNALACLENSSAEDQQFYEDYCLLRTVQRGVLIRICKVAKMYKQSEMTLVLAWGSSSEDALLRGWMLGKTQAEAAWSLKQGRAPQGYMERQLSLWATELMS